MRPRTAPIEFGVTDTALAAADRYGATNRYRQAVDHAIAVVWEYAKYGIPAELGFDDWVHVDTGVSQGDWWIYIDEVQDIYLGFAETARAESLRFIALAPAKEISRSSFLQSCRDAA